MDGGRDPGGRGGWAFILGASSELHFQLIWTVGSSGPQWPAAGRLGQGLGEWVAPSSRHSVQRQHG